MQHEAFEYQLDRDYHFSQSYQIDSPFCRYWENNNMNIIKR